MWWLLSNIDLERLSSITCHVIKPCTIPVTIIQLWWPNCVRGVKSDRGSNIAVPYRREQLLLTQWCWYHTQGSYSAWKILESAWILFLKFNSRPLKVLENGVGPWKYLKSPWILNCSAWKIVFHYKLWMRVADCQQRNNGVTYANSFIGQ